MKLAVWPGGSVTVAKAVPDLVATPSVLPAAFRNDTPGKPVSVHELVPVLTSR